MSFFTASPTEETNLKSSSNVKIKTEAKSKVCAVGAHKLTCVCTLLSVYRCYEFFVLPCALVLC